MVLAPLLIEMSVWIIALGVLIFCILAVYIAKALFGLAGGTLGKLPIVGGWINSGLHTVEHKIVSVMSTAAAGAQSLCGAALHMMARQVDWIGREIKSHSNLLAALALLSLGVVDYKALSKALRGVHTQAQATAGTVTHTTTRIINVEKRIERGIGEDVLPRVRSLEREYAHVTGLDIPRLREIARTAERDAARAWRVARANTRAWGTLAFAGAVAWALARVGAGWTRCAPFRLNQKRLCALDPSLFEALLLDTTLIVGSLSLVEFAREMVGVTDTAVRPITTFWRAS